MAIDIEQFRAVFFEESFEGLDTMEAGLLDLGAGGADAETVNGIFRAAHSIKGGSGTFGFTEVADFTHLLETLLDQVREGARAVTRDLVDLLLESVDCLRAMLDATKAGRATDRARASQLQGRLEAARAAPAASAAEQRGGAGQPAATPCGWRIRFRPRRDMLRTGNDPVRLFRELDALGELSVQADLSGLPALAELDPEACYLGWDLVLRGGARREQVAEIFEWVEDECDLEISALAEAADDARPAVPRAPERRTGARREGGAAVHDSGSIRVSIERVDELINLVGELVITQSMLSQIAHGLDMSRLPGLRDGLEQLARNTREIQGRVMQIRMLPVSFCFNRLPRLVHDLAGKLGKRVDLELSGEDTELDRTVLEKIGDPLVHLVRNALDHGIEPPEVRRAAGKPEAGRLHLHAYHAGGNIVIEVRDDGAGIDQERVLRTARQRGLVGAEDEPPEERINNLIFQPGFSTVAEVSDVSGRGVGMDVVRRNIKDLGGTVEVESRRGTGSTFTIRLPLTLAILDGQLVRVGCETYVISLLSIIETVQVCGDRMRSVAGQAELYRARGEYLPVVRLHELLGAVPDGAAPAGSLLVLVEADGERAGLLVDELLGQQQVIIKSLATNYRPVQGLSGATILGDGTVALILDVPGLIRRFRGARGGPEGGLEQAAA